MRRRDFIAFVCGTAAWPGLAFAQQKRTAKRIGFIANAPLPPVKRFRERLQTLGWVEGENLIIESRYGEGKDLPVFAAELVSCRWTSLSCGARLPHSRPSVLPPRYRF